jgi:hypothetical protein
MRRLPLLIALIVFPLIALGQRKEGDEKQELVPGKYDKAIDKGLDYLIRRQNAKTGNFGGGMYAHGLAALALCEAYGLSSDPKLRSPAQKAINFIVFAQHPSNGGWRYAPGQEGDLSVTGWQVMALRCAQMSGLDVPKQTTQSAVDFLNSVMSPSDKGYGYLGVGSTPTMTAVGLLCRQKFQEWGPQKLEISEGVKNHIRVAQPNPKSLQKNVYFYFYATQVMRNFGGQHWEEWNQGMREGLLRSQDTNESSPNFGSWSSAGDPHGGAGGRLMITSLNLLTLEVYYRYPPDARAQATNSEKAENALSYRSREARIRALAADGGTKESEAAVARGLEWIAKQQSPDGHWSLDGKFKDKGTPNDIAGTAFGLLPLFGTGYSHKPTTGDPLKITIPDNLADLKKAVADKERPKIEKVAPKD